MRKVIISLSLAAALPAAAAVIGDASRGAGIFEEQKCVSCHSIGGEGGRTAPDLGKGGARGWSPAGFAALVWNHAPAMWSAMDKANIAKPNLSQQQSADLFAYFFAARAFDAPGDAGRGRRLFINKGCAECHNLTSSSAAGGPPVVQWESVTDVIEVARQMWNHAPQMRAAAEKKNVKTPQLTVAEMNDILVYLRSMPAVRNIKPAFSPASPETGDMLFAAKGCKGCHEAEKVVTSAKGIRSMAELAVTMWNHSGSMKQLSELRPEEMRRIVGFLWNRQFELASKDAGNSARGEKVLSAKGCAGCHTSGPGPSLKGRGVNAYEMVSAIWGHGPSMMKAMESKKVAWPRMNEREMEDALAALQ